MPRTLAIDDLFGHVPQAGELDLPRPAATRSPVIVGGVDITSPPGGHTRDSIRATLSAIIAHLRAASVLPWDARDLRYMTGTAPYMAEWLKNGEGDALLAEMKAELDRLGAPAEQLAPNWREIWGIAA